MYENVLECSLDLWQDYYGINPKIDRDGWYIQAKKWFQFLFYFDLNYSFGKVVWYLLLFYLLWWSTIVVKGSIAGGHARVFPFTVIMVLATVS
jgi:hypothetical protein